MLIVKQFTQDKIPPSKLASLHSCSVETIRRIVKKARKNLPSKYYENGSQVMFDLVNHANEQLQFYKFLVYLHKYITAEKVFDKILNTINKTYIGS